MSIEESIKIISKNDIALVELDLPGEKVNKLSTPVMTRLKEVLEELRGSSYKAVIFISRKPKIFIAGADIEEIKAIKKRDDALHVVEIGQNIINMIEDLPMPAIAAINGACLGGGCEFSLACDYRILTNDPSTRIGLPETKLGIIPGFGGCIRLPRVIGIQAALDIILAGKSVDGRKAEKLGLADKCVPVQQLEYWALKMAKDLIASGSKKRKKYFKAAGAVNVLMNSIIGRMVVFHQARKMLLAQTKGNYPAQEAALEVVHKTYGMSNRTKALSVEAEAFADLAISDISKNLIHIFYMTEAIKKQT